MSMAKRDDIGWMDDAEKFEVLANMIADTVHKSVRHMGPYLGELHFTQDALRIILKYANEIKQIGK
jgi:hypothetical protein